jgi:peroxiredoxin
LPPGADHRIWGARFDWDRMQLRYRRDDNQPDGALRFREFRTTLLDPVYEFKWDTVYTFGLKEGLLLKGEQKFAQGVGFNGEGTEAWSVTSVKRHGPAWAGVFAREQELLFAARRGGLAISAAISARPRDAAALLANSKKAMEGVLVNCQTAEAQEMCQHYLEHLKADEEYYLGQAEKFAELLDRPAPSWETTDWDGKKYALADFQGKVVVLDFWYRGCGWCIRSMPQVKQLHEEFKDQGVAVLGMCADDEEENARFVTDYLNLDYPTLKGEGLQEKYGDGGWPTLVLIDQQGVVRRLHIGYSPTLREELAAEVKALLKERE